MAYSTIPKGSLYMNTKLYTGDGAASHAITGVGFQPDLCWVKKRSSPATDHNLNTSVNLGSGTASQYVLTSNSAELLQDNGSTYFQSLDSDGFTIGNSDKVNANSANFASWNWKAGTAVSGSTTGSGTAKTYTGSVNTTSGFSIIKYTGNGTAGHTIPHHLGAAPQMIIVKALSTNDDWMVGHTAAGFNQFMILNSTARDATGTQFNSTVPTSSVFSIGSNNNMNQNNNSFVAYSFTNIKGFSKFGGYTGNGSADGTFIYTGFSPAFVMIKNVSQAANWNIKDNRRNNASTSFNINPRNATLLPNDNAADQDANALDFLSNGFKNRSTGGDVNGTEDYLYMAFAENPFVATSGTSALPVTAR